MKKSEAGELINGLNHQYPNWLSAKSSEEQFKIIADWTLRVMEFEPQPFWNISRFFIEVTSKQRGAFPPSINDIVIYIRLAIWEEDRRQRMNSEGQISHDSRQKRLEAGPVGISKVTRGLLDELREKIQADTPEEVEEPRRDTSETADWRRRNFKDG